MRRLAQWLAPSQHLAPPLHRPHCLRREGYTTDFGIVDIDFKDPRLPRRVKQSANWLKNNVFTKSTRR